MLKIMKNNNPEEHKSTDVTPQASDAQPKHRLQKRTVYIGLIVLFFLIIISVGSIFLLKPRKTAKQEPKADLNRSISTMENKYIGRVITYKFPTGGQWQRVDQQNGSEYTYKSAGSCLVKFSTSNNVKSLVNSGATLNSQMISRLENINNSLNSKSLVLGTTASHEFNSNFGKTEFMTKDSEYTDNEGYKRNIRLYGQWIGDYQLFISTDCRSEDWANQQNSLNEFLDTVSINIS